MAVNEERSDVLRRFLPWGLVALVLPYAAFAISSAGAEALHLLGLAQDVRPRVAPFVFIVHVLAGTVALVGGALQLIPRLRGARPGLHRRIGRAYVVGVFVSGVTAFRVSITFDVPIAARVSFAVLSVLWVTTTVLGVRAILVRAVENHRAWMSRSYALTLFFLTGPAWMGAAERVPLPYEIAYPVAVTLAWLLNLAVAELYIRRGRKERDVGSVEEGKLADLVLLNSDPLENISNAQDILMVIKGGVVVDREGLDLPVNR